MTGNPCFYRNYYEDTSQQQVEYAQFGDIKKGHAKWEGRIQKGLRQGLESEDWMEKRNALLLLSQSYEFFPVVEKHAGYILKLVDGIKDQQDGFNDVKTLAMSLAVKLRSRQEFWVDKVEQEPAKRRAAEASQGDKTAGRSKNGLGTSSSQTKPDDSKGAVLSERG